MLSRPHRLPRPGRTGQHDQRGIGQCHSRPQFRRIHSLSLADRRVAGPRGNFQGKTGLPTSLVDRRILNMVRGAFPLRTALCAVTASVAIVTFTTGQASAWTSASGSAASAHSAPARCQASGSGSASRPPSRRPGRGDGETRMERGIPQYRRDHVFTSRLAARNGSDDYRKGGPGQHRRCEVQQPRGRPRLAGRPPSGERAVVTAMSPTASRECVTSWMLKLTLPGTDHPVTVRRLASLPRAWAVGCNCRRSIPCRR